MSVGPFLEVHFLTPSDTQFSTQVGCRRQCTQLLTHFELAQILLQGHAHEEALCFEHIGRTMMMVVHQTAQLSRRFCAFFHVGIKNPSGTERKNVHHYNFTKIWFLGNPIPKGWN
jgi:Icc-related predicted phosphoesterase